MSQPRNMLFMLRLYSGLVDSIKTGIWNPSGTPAIFKLLEEVQRQGLRAEFLFYCPIEFEADIKRSNKEIMLRGFGSPIRIVFTPAIFKFLPSRLRDPMTQLYWAMVSLLCAWTKKYDKFYTDRGNIIGGALVARFSRLKTIIRLLGMPAEVASLLTNNRPTSLVYRWAYKSKFTQIIATRDGSSIIPFLSVGIHKDTPYEIKVNGVDVIPNSVPRPLNNPIIIGFIGRLSRGKGAEKLIEAAAKITNSNFEIKIAGYGPDMDQLQNLIAANKLEHKVKLLGRLAHTDLQKEISNWDIYVSLNEFGQISNANLEACKAGLCLVFIENEKENDAKNLFARNQIRWIKRTNIIEDLAENISELVENPTRIQEYKRNTRDFAETLNDWPTRIQWEIDVLKLIESDHA